MAITDPIADMFTCIRNANMKKKNKVIMYFSKMKQSILDILLQEGYIKEYKKIEKDNKLYLEIFLKYYNDKLKLGVINNIQKVSKPGLRIYKSIKNISKVKSGMGIVLLSTSKGVITDKDARKLNVGGEIIGYIW